MGKRKTKFGRLTLKFIVGTHSYELIWKGQIRGYVTVSAQDMQYYHSETLRGETSGPHPTKLRAANALMDKLLEDNKISLGM